MKGQAHRLGKQDDVAGHAGQALRPGFAGGEALATLHDVDLRIWQIDEATAPIR